MGLAEMQRGRRAPLAIPLAQCLAGCSSAPAAAAGKPRHGAVEGRRLKLVRQRPGGIGNKCARAAAAIGGEPLLKFGYPHDPDWVPPVI
jgi:hypothetical protein